MASVSVCLLVSFMISAKVDEVIKVLFRCDSGGLKKPYIRWGV